MRADYPLGAASPATDVVLAFLACGGRRDFSSAEALLAEDITRTGPDGDVKSGRVAYLAYLESVLKEALDYHYDVRRCTVSHDGATVVVELDEYLTDAGGAQISVSEAMIFDLTAEGRIVALSVYTKIPK